MGNGWEMIGEYPTYVLRSGAFLAGPFFFPQKSAPFNKKCLFGCFYEKPPLLMSQSLQKILERWSAWRNRCPTAMRNWIDIMRRCLCLKLSSRRQKKHKVTNIQKKEKLIIDRHSIYIQRLQAIAMKKDKKKKHEMEKRKQKQQHQKQQRN